MASAYCKVIALLIFNIINVILGITTMILGIVFRLMGFESISIAIGTCIDFYLLTKYYFIINQLKISFLLVCISVAMFIVALILVILTLMKLRQHIQNNSQNQKEIIPIQILPRSTYCMIYIFQTLGGLGVVVSFGYYMTFLVDFTSQLLTCSFAFNPIQLIFLILLTVCWLVSFIVVFFVTLNLNPDDKDQKLQETKNKYREMVNTTQEPEPVWNRQNKYNNNHNNNEQRRPSHGQLKNNNTNQNLYQGSNLDTSNNRKNSVPSIFTLNMTQEQPYQNNQEKQPSPYERSQKKQSYQQYKERQLRQARNKKKYQNNNSTPQNNYNPEPNYQDSRSNRVKFDDDQEPKQSRNDFEDKRPKPNSRYFNEAPKYDKYPSRNQPHENTPVQSYRPTSSKRGQAEETKGQLMFHKKGDISRIENESPSKIESKFMREQQDYLKQNARGSVLPSNNSVKESSPERRKQPYDDSYNYNESDVSQSRNKAKAREGVLTSYIRGKFN